MLRAWIFSSTRWWSFSMYITPTVTSWSNGSPVRPSKSTIWPDRGRFAVVEQLVDLGLARAVEHRRRDVDARAEPLAERDDLLVRQLVDEVAEVLVVVDALQLLAQLVAAPLLLDVRLRSARPSRAPPSRGGSRESARCSCGDGTPKRVEHHVHRAAVLEVGHVLLGEDA